MAKEKKPSTNHTSPHERDTSLFSIDKIRSGTTGSLMTKIIMGLLIVVFAVGFLFMDPGIIGGLGGGAGDGGGGPVNLNETVASIAGEKITRGQFLQAQQQQEQLMAQYGMNIGPSDQLAMGYRTLQSLAGNIAMVVAAEGEGIKVTDKEVDAKIKSDIDTEIEQQEKQNAAGFRRQVEARFGSVQGYRDELTKQMQANREDIRRALMVERLQKKIEDSAGASEEQFKRSHTKLKVRQLVVDVPAVAPDAKDRKDALDKAEAKAKVDIEKYAKEARTTPTLETFTKLVQQHSDDAQTKSKGGDLGWKLPQEFPIDYPMRQALMDSKESIVGPLQDSTTKTYFLFFIEGRKLELPKDYAQKKDEYLKEDKEARGSQVWNDYQQKVTATVQEQLEIKDPTYQAFALQNEKIPTASGAEADKLRQQAIDLYQKGLKHAIGTDAAAIRLQMASLYTSLKQPQKAEEVLAVAAKESPGEPQVLLSYATALRENKKTEEALKELKATSELLDNSPAAPAMFGGNPNDALRFQIASEYEVLGKKDLAEAERKKVTPSQSPGLSMQ